MDEITEIKRRAGIPDKPKVHYAVVVPTLSTNGSINEPALYSFKASSDKEAINQFQTERRRSLNSNFASRVVSVNTNWYKVAVLMKVIAYPDWTDRKVLVPSSNTIPSWAEEY